jgi:hypothetical protein
MVLLDAGHLLGQAPVEGRAFRDVAPHRAVDPLELALDDALLGLAAGGQQDLAVAARKVEAAPRRRVL